MNNFIKDLNQYISNYDIEKSLFAKGPEIKKRGWLTKDEFLLICLWKSRRPKQWYKKNTQSRIRKITQAAFLEKDEHKKMEFLIQLSGVRIPTASAILSIVDPKKYPIIDVRCVSSLTKLNAITWSHITINSWIDYLKVIRRLAKENRKSAREIEKGLFAYNRMQLDKEYRNLY